MNFRIRPELNVAKRALLIGAMTIAIGTPVLFGLAGKPIQAEVPQVAALVRATASPFSSSPTLPQGPNPQTLPASPAAPQTSDLANWASSEVSLIVTDEEVRAFKILATDAERQRFIELFWKRRDPTPDTSANEFETEFYARVSYANDHFSAGVPGSESDRGKMYILNGPPDEIVSHLSGGTYYSDQSKGGGVTNTFPFETWRYRHVDGIGKGDNVIYEFVDSTKSGNYRLEYDPSAKVNPLATPTQ